MNASLTTNRLLMTILLILVVGFAIFFFSSRHDDRNVFQRMGDAVEELPNGADKAADEFNDKSPAQKVGDAIEDAGENMKRSVE